MVSLLGGVFVSKRIIPLFLSVVILFSAFSPIPASADYTNSHENVSYWEGILIRGVKGTSGTDWGGLIQGLAGKLAGISVAPRTIVFILRTALRAQDRLR